MGYKIFSFYNPVVRFLQTIHAAIKVWMCPTYKKYMQWIAWCRLLFILLLKILLQIFMVSSWQNFVVAGRVSYTIPASCA